jgi:hypothetical protein
MTDKRASQIGKRKPGYCGHIPENIYFERDSFVEAAIHPLRGNIERRVPVAAQDLSSKERSPKKSQGADPLDEAHVLERLARCSPPQNRERSPVREGLTPPKHIPGYGGHRQGVAEQQPRDTLRVVRGSSVPRYESIPRMPFVRGPTRVNPLGQDVFLSI